MESLNSKCLLHLVDVGVLGLFLYGPFCHGALNVDPIYIVCNIIFFEYLLMLTTC